MGSPAYAAVRCKLAKAQGNERIGNTKLSILIETRKRKEARF
jgi:hypothetical protein